MKRTMPKWLKIAATITGSLLFITICAYAGLVILANNTQAAYKQITPVNLQAVDDGVYNGKAGGFLCSMDLDVTVTDHRMTNIAVNHQVNGGGKYQAPGMADRILDAQSLEVDTISGATLTSQTILVAVHEALMDGER